jgi:hypothetical protein
MHSFKVYIINSLVQAFIIGAGVRMVKRPDKKEIQDSCGAAFIHSIRGMEMEIGIGTQGITNLLTLTIQIESFIIEHNSYIQDPTS